ncbi:MAG: hypothetical protein ACFB9M_09745 [Myxococcota bacterium]
MRGWVVIAFGVNLLLPRSSPAQERNESYDSSGSVSTSTASADTELEPESKASRGWKLRDVKFRVGGAIWVNLAYQAFDSLDPPRRGDFRFDNFRIAFDGEWNGLLASAQYRLYSFTDIVHHGWIGYRFLEHYQVEIGITQVPFGLLPFATHSYWFGLGYYIGFEDDYDAGFKLAYSRGPLDLHVAFFINEELSNATDFDRYSTDLARVDEQQTEEEYQGNLRAAYTFGRGSPFSTQWGLSGQVSSLPNLTTNERGIHWAAGVHFRGNYRGWNPEFQLVRYEFHPKNPVGVDDRLVLMANLSSTRFVAAKAYLINLNLRRTVEVGLGPLQRLRFYVDYSHHIKDVDEFNDSQLIDPGFLLEMGPFWVWTDFLVARNAQYLNDSLANSGPGPGGTDRFEFRFNINFEWYFYYPPEEAPTAIKGRRTKGR